MALTGPRSASCWSTPVARRQYIAQRLMAAAEAAMPTGGRSLIVLDTRDGVGSDALYRSLGDTEGGQIPHYARSADGELHTTVFSYKDKVAPAPEIAATV